MKNKDDAPDDEITAEEAAALLNVHPAHIRWYHRQGLLPGQRRRLRIGAPVLMFRRVDVEAFEKPKKTGRPPKNAAARKPPKDKVAPEAKGKGRGKQ
jgi:hypothetical protein